ncbi:MAG: phosphoribosylformylglycinamidine cyclo-ligase [Candidatus Aminicenantes bacterium RBG_13_62_12]|nr:MAG: phosphoribosylformylglycinamidine cyclo-ligase [Candidatus Aminicenantes bacterium RBG_13_62_12]
MPKLNYIKAGVNIGLADEFIGRIKPLVKTTGRPEVIGGLGGFSGLFAPRLAGIIDPVLVASTDGVGTKLLVAEALGKHDTVGVDLVAMCVDDVAVVGAEPLFFLDYIACGKVMPSKLQALVRGMVRGCREAGCALLGGETAELPGMYAPGAYDLAGFAVGIVSRNKIIDGRRCRPGDAVLGLASSGLHSNGYSLVRKVFSPREIKADPRLGRELLKPTRIYAKKILSLMRKVPVKAMAHITGGGFYDNIPRVVPDGLGVRIRRGSWPTPRIFRVLQERGGVAEREMFRTFNMGVGMAVVVDRRDAPRALRHLASLGQRAWPVGELVRGRRGVVID